MKLGLGGSKRDPYLQCHEINTSIAQGGLDRFKDLWKGGEGGEGGGEVGEHITPS